MLKKPDKFGIKFWKAANTVCGHKVYAKYNNPYLGKDDFQSAVVKLGEEVVL